MRSRRGLTLIEVLASLAILGSLLVIIVQSRSSHVRQWHQAQLKSEAVHAADRLLRSWWSNPAALPSNDTGTWEERWRWRTSIVATPALKDAALEAQLVRLEISEDGRPAAASLVRIDFFTLVEAPAEETP